MTSNYYNTFRERLTADGWDYKEQVESLARRNFDNYLAETPSSVKIKYNGEEYKVAIVENRQDEFRLSKQMLSSINNYFPIGSLIYWQYFSPIDCPENFWIVWKQQQNSIKDHYVSYISRCNHKLKWIDDHGVRHEQYVYEFSSKENMIRATFKSRVQEIIASEPNKFMEIIMPFTTDIKREQRFIVDGEAWYVIEFDSSSVDGITYITLGEDKKDLQNDLLIKNGDNEDLADYKEENKFFISLINENPVVEKNTSYVIKPYYYEKGVLTSAYFRFYIDNIEVGEGEFLERVYSEDTKVLIVLDKKEEITKTIDIKVIEEENNNSTYVLVGDSNIKWGKCSGYMVEKEYLGNVEIVSNVSYSIDNEDIASLEIENNICYIIANNKRKTGKIILTASGEDFSVEKIINITSLW